jgi:hypothetical protein
LMFHPLFGCHLRGLIENVVIQSFDFGAAFPYCSLNILLRSNLLSRAELLAAERTRSRICLDRLFGFEFLGR